MSRSETGRMQRRAVFPLLALALAGCGFRPIYATRGGSGPVRHELSQIDVVRLPERSGMLLRQALQQRLADPGARPAKIYELYVGLSIQTEGLGVQQDQTNTRSRSNASATWTLKSLDATGAVIGSGVARALDGVNVIDQQYFEADLANESATRRLTEVLANQITLQLAAFFAKRGAPA